MFPDIVSIGPFTIHTYGFMIVLGFGLGTWIAAHRARREGIDPAFVVDLAFYLLVAGMLGAKLLYLFHYPLAFIEDLRAAESITQFIQVIGSGFVFYGGLLAAIPVGIILIRNKSLNVWKVADLMAPSIALAHGMGRLGCFAAGCCHGKACHAWYGITFNDPNTLAPRGTPLYPTQPLSAAGLFLIFAILSCLLRRKRFDGQVFWIYVLLYAPMRFMIEFLRGDPRPLYFGGWLSQSQAIGLIMALIAGIMLVVLRKKNTGE
ncbi:prolipoprotein diacylglyceryl transferase [bacterium]|nr:prolipoprotein diacylglyceryl transferase [candidate division CSSED10-310 bacterium]